MNKFLYVTLNSSYITHVIDPSHFKHIKKKNDIETLLMVFDESAAALKSDSFYKMYFLFY